MKENLVLILKGMLIGIGKIIPGVSGSMIAILLNVYDKAIYSILHINYKNIKYLSVLGSGILFSIVFMSRGVIFLLNNWYVPVMFLFIGFISGGSVSLISDCNIKKNYIYFIIPILFLVLLEFFMIDIQIPKNIFTYIIVGGIEALTMIIPGISGTAVLMIIDFYDKVLGAFANVDVSFLTPFFIGMGVTSLISIKFIDSLYNRHKDIFCSLVFGFSIGSIILLLMNIWSYIFSTVILLIGLLMFVVGLFIPLLMEKIKV